MTNQKLGLYDRLCAEDLLCTWAKDAVDAQAFFFKHYPAALKRKNRYELVLLVADVYKASAFFPNEQLRAVFVSLGLNSYYRRWFLPLATILEQLHGIAAHDDALLLWQPMLHCIKAHIEVKIMADILDWAGLTATLNKEPDTLKTKIDFYNCYRVRDKHTGLLKRPSAYRERMNGLILQMERAVGDKKLVKDLLYDLSEGNTKKSFILAITQSCLVHPNVNTIVHRLYPLLQLLSPAGDLYLPDEGKHTWSRKRKEHDQYFNRTMRSFQTKRIKNITR